MVLHPSVARLTEHPGKQEHLQLEGVEVVNKPASQRLVQQVQFKFFSKLSTSSTVIMANSAQPEQIYAPSEKLWIWREFQGCHLQVKAEAEDKSTEESLLAEKETKDEGFDLWKPTSVHKSSELNKNLNESERVSVVDEDDDDADELGDVHILRSGLQGYNKIVCSRRKKGQEANV